MAEEQMASGMSIIRDTKEKFQSWLRVFLLRSLVCYKYEQSFENWFHFAERVNAVWAVKKESEIFCADWLKTDVYRAGWNLSQKIDIKSAAQFVVSPTVEERN